jgi:hypothetical protein
MRRYAHWWLDRCFLYVGRMATTKGVLQILEAWLGLADDLGSDCPPLWLVGGDIQEIEIIRHAVGIDVLSPHEVDRRLQWWGYLDTAGISAMLLKAYVLVTHSLYEPGGRVVLEALAQGIPVIATPHGFARDLIVDWHDGFLVNYGDVATLRTRMSHFALQPLLRHAMGRRAQVIATAALSRWSFMETHLHIYSFAANGESIGRTLTSRENSRYSCGPSPQGFGGAYPFEVELADTAAAEAFFRCHNQTKDPTISDLPSANGRSRLWLVRQDESKWIIKHAFTTYRKRPMWDRGFQGPAAETQRLRITGEILGAQAQGAAPIIAADPASGLILRRWLAKAQVAEDLQATASLLAVFHSSELPGIDFGSIRADVDRNWGAMQEEDLIASLVDLEARWQSEERPWSPWTAMSLRLGWRWLEVGLRRNWLRLPAGIDVLAKRRLAAESLVVAELEPVMRFGLCHGDADPDHFRMREDGTFLLIDCERCHPGYFGHDWACTILHLLQNSEPAEVQKTLNQSLQVVDRPTASPRLLLSWLRWTTLMQICRTSGLMEIASRDAGLRIWEQLERH